MKRIALLFVLAVAFSGCGEKETYAFWKSEGYEGETRQEIEMAVFGTKEGKPIVAVVVKYFEGAEDTPKFKWKHNIHDDGMHSFDLAGTRVSPKEKFVVYFNDHRGEMQSHPFSEAVQKKYFEKTSKPSQEALLAFWRSEIEPKRRKQTAK